MVCWRTLLSVSVLSGFPFDDYLKIGYVMPTEATPETEPFLLGRTRDFSLIFEPCHPLKLRNLKLQEIRSSFGDRYSVNYVPLAYISITTTLQPTNQEAIFSPSRTFKVIRPHSLFSDGDGGTLGVPCSKLKIQRTFSLRFSRKTP
ncbi:hypothetical protein TNCV_3678801 [Trichonephila clavipes]|nr:hypothetical protein TNCV_3678801 [Trichonephila clavipes]